MALPFTLAGGRTKAYSLDGSSFSNYFRFRLMTYYFDIFHLLLDLITGCLPSCYCYICAIGSLFALLRLLLLYLTVHPSVID